MSYESLALHGRYFTSVHLLDVKPDQAQQWKGPVTRQRTTFVRRRYPSKEHTRHADPWRGRRPLKILLGASAMRERSPAVDRLLALARVDDVEVFAVGPIAEPVDGLTVLALSIEEEPPLVRHGADDGPAGSTADDADESAWQPEKVRGSFVGEVTYRDGRSDVRAMLRTEKLLPRWFQHKSAHTLEAHEAFEHMWDVLLAEQLDLDVVTVGDGFAARLSYVTTRPRDTGGVLSARDALTTVETFLRGRDVYIVHLEPRARGDVDATLFYANLVAAQMPGVLDAFRSCLSPQRRADSRRWRDALEAVMARQHDLCVATQQLRELSFQEGYLGGTNTLQARQLYHAQTALTLAVGTMDVLAGLTADLVGLQPPGPQRSWNRMLEGAGTWKQAPAQAQQIIDLARGHRSRPLLDLAGALRIAYQHQGMLKAGTLDVRSGARVTEAAFTVIILDLALGEVAKGEPIARLTEAWDAGLVDASHGVVRLKGESSFVAVPHLLVTAVTQAVAAIAQDVVGVFPWPDADWVVDPDEARDRQVAEFLWG